MDMTKKNASVRANPNDVKNRIAVLKSPAYALLRQLVSLQNGISLIVDVPVKELACQLHMSERSVSTSMNSLMSTGLVTRISVSGRFGPSVTNLTSLDVVKYINEPFLTVKSPTKRKTSLKKGPADFDYLTDLNRTTNVASDVEIALTDGKLYWEFIEQGFANIGFSGSLSCELQSRSRHTGERTGLHRGRGWSVRSINSAISMPKFAKHAHVAQTEATFRVDKVMHPLLLVDDLSVSDLARLPRACAILETSPGNFQATLIAPRVLNAKEFILAEDGLLDLLGAGDKGAKGSRQLRRFPGSINNKPSLSASFVTRVHKISNVYTLTVTELESLIARGIALRPYLDGVSNADSVVGCVSSVNEANDGATILTTLLEPAESMGNAKDRSGSGRDFGKAIELIRRGMDDASICDQICLNAKGRLKYGPFADEADIKGYAERTVRSARQRYRPSELARPKV
jgi:hypothetical protein